MECQPELSVPFSGRDQLLPSLQEGERLRGLLPKCELRKFDESGHFLFLVQFSPFQLFCMTLFVVFMSSQIHYIVVLIIIKKNILLVCSFRVI